MANQPVFDVFISYSKMDKTVADLVCSRLEESKIKCWYAPRDIKPGDNYGAAIIKAFSSVKVLILIFTSASNQSVHVLREIERAINKKIKVIPFRIENREPESDLEYFISTCQWIDAFTNSLEEHVEELVKAVKNVLPSPHILSFVKNSVYKWLKVIDGGHQGEDLEVQCLSCSSIKKYDPIFRDYPPDICPVCSFDGEIKSTATWYVIQAAGMGDRDIRCRKCKDLTGVFHYSSDYVIPDSCPNCNFSG